MDTLKKVIKEEGSILTSTSITNVDRFKTICDSMLQLYNKKNTDYGNSFSDLYKEFGITSSLIRLTDKLNRLKSITNNNSQQVKDESIKDTLIDLANYSIMTLIELDKVNSDKNK